MPKNRPSATKATNADEDARAHLEPNEASKEQDESMSGDESSVMPDPGELMKSLSNFAELGEDYSEPEAEESGLESSSDSESEESEDSESGESEDDSEASGDSDSDMECDSDYMFEDANVNLQAENLQFWLHEHVLAGFRRLKSKLDRIAWDDEEEWKLLKLDDDVEDVQNMLAVLYSRPYEPLDFDADTLESTLMLATKYDHPSLRAFAIRRLKKLSLKPIEQFRISREYDVAEWEDKAIDALVNRDKPITKSEARILKYATLVKIAAKREQVRYEKGQRSQVKEAGKR